jgi:hypothetical protein
MQAKQIARSSWEAALAELQHELDTIVGMGGDICDIDMVAAAKTSQSTITCLIVIFFTEGGGDLLLPPSGCLHMRTSKHTHGGRTVAFGGALSRGGCRPWARERGPARHAGRAERHAVGARADGQAGEQDRLGRRDDEARALLQRGLSISKTLLINMLVDAL